MATRKSKTTKSRRPRRKFTDEFRSDIVRLCQSDSDSISDICKRMDPTESEVRGWIKKAEEEGGTGDAQALTASEKQELQRLRREVKQLKVEREILKKAATFFAKEST